MHSVVLFTGKVNIGSSILGQNFVIGLAGESTFIEEQDVEYEPKTV